jgi:agmatinase
MAKFFPFCLGLRSHLEARMAEQLDHKIAGPIGREHCIWRNALQKQTLHNICKKEARKMNPFSGLRTFLKAPILKHGKSANYTVIGIPYDLSTTFRSGARMAPAAIREASLMLTDGDHPRYWNNPVKENLIADAGDIELIIADSQDYLAQIQNTLMKYTHPIILGGDHSITLAALRAANQKHGKVALIHFDAHLDTWDLPANHGTFVRQAIQERLIDPKQSIQIGVRSPVPNSVRKWTEYQELLSIPSWDVHNYPLHTTVKKIQDRIGKDTLCYLTFDIDCLDPSAAPGTGTPEIGGLTTFQATEIMHDIRNLNYVGMDMVEVCPPYDNNQITSIAAATIVYNYICQRCLNK